MFVPTKEISKVVGRLDLPYHQRMAMEDYILGLMVSQTKTILDMSRVVGSSNKSLERLLRSDINPGTIWKGKAEAMKEFNGTRPARDGVLIIDDTGIEKSMKMAYEFFDHSESRLKKGFVVVGLHYSDHKTHYPLEAEIYFPEKYAVANNIQYRGKNEIAIKLLEKWLEWPHSYVVFDAWYCSRQMLRFLDSKGERYVTRIKANRLVRMDHGWVAISEYITRTGKWSGTVTIKGIGKVRFVAKYNRGWFILISNNLHITDSDMERIYSMRWDIEVWHKQAKQCLGLSSVRVRDWEAIRRHIAITSLAYACAALGLVDEESKGLQRCRCSGWRGKST